MKSIISKVAIATVVTAFTLNVYASDHALRADTGKMSKMDHSKMSKMDHKMDKKMDKMKKKGKMGKDTASKM